MLPETEYCRLYWTTCCHRWTNEKNTSCDIPAYNKSCMMMKKENVYTRAHMDPFVVGATVMKNIARSIN